MTPVTLRSPIDRLGFFTHLERLLQAGVPWCEVDWQIESDWQRLPVERLPRILARLPADFVATAKAVLLHTDRDRFMRLHKTVQTLQQQPDAWGDALNPEHAHLAAMARQVRRDLHKMKAFVRFNAVPGGTGVAHGGCSANAPLPGDGLTEARCQAAAPPSPPPSGSTDRYVAWFEPHHHIVEAAAPFFVRRFASMRWSILTPKGCVHWDGDALCVAPPARKADVPPADAGEALWLTYYERTFNPARVKVAALKKEMPLYYWNNLPEARRIAPLLAEAGQRTDRMLRHTEDSPHPLPRSGSKAPK